MFMSTALAVTMQVVCLTNELREMILLKACWLMNRAEMKSETRPYVDVYVALASVCAWFYEVVSNKHFCGRIRQTLKGLYPFTDLTLVQTLSR